MNTAVSAEEIKEIRSVYGLSQKSFAVLLGIGEASIVRYEQGAVPSKANSKLIRAAKNPQFILECLEDDGDLIPASQRERAERYIYEIIDFDSGKKEVNCDMGRSNQTNKMDEIYELVLWQEVLNEKAAAIACELMRCMGERGIEVDALNDPIALLLAQVFDLKQRIIGKESRNRESLSKIEGCLEYLQKYVNSLAAEVHAA